jgi:hypothetical protein
LRDFLPPDLPEGLDLDLGVEAVSADSATTRAGADFGDFVLKDFLEEDFLIGGERLDPTDPDLFSFSYTGPDAPDASASGTFSTAG